MTVSCSTVFSPPPKPGLSVSPSVARGERLPERPVETESHRASLSFPLCGGRASLLFQPIAMAVLLCLFWQLAIGEVDVHGQAPVSEYTAKAASLALLPNYVKWPVPATAPLTVGILGDDPFGGALDKMNPKRSKRIEDLKDCQIVFVANSEREKVGAILETLAGANILTVGESEGFAKNGGVIGFVIEKDQVRFEVNLGAARQAGLKLDLRLLKLAVRVITS